MATETVEKAMSPPLRSPVRNAVDPPPSSKAIVIRPLEGGEPAPALLLSPVAAKAAVRAPVEVRQAAEAENSKVVSWILRRRWLAVTVRRVDVAARMVAAALCLISFSVMAADKDRGWTTDAFNIYKEYRYCLSVNVIGFVYAGFQAYAEVHHMSSKKHIIRRPMGNYFNFAMDQILAYLLISASSSATARTNYWVTNWGTDPFPNMISGSVAVSFLAFVAFAVSSLISAYNLFNRSI
ncbi:CASP-like protein 4A1 [Phalaenopsis equestris]|uniref:CASP-like protein 4A1 n=1 Tax=Phalaenopsis equestris TaxID=78828 RepID=UPI0009E5AA0E|nr:CASP-like protein 4A1 [Phalaenopsis equestris]